MLSYFLHHIGKSTLTQGVTVPVECRECTWLASIDKGESVPVHLHFRGIEVDAVLRRINNAVGHLQVRYENKQAKPLRDALLQGCNFHYG